MIEYFIALTPEQQLYKKIESVKSYVFENFGDQAYLLDPPHSTLCVGTTGNIKETNRELEKFTETNKRVGFGIIDWLIFANDKVTKSSSLVLRFDENCIKSLRQVQAGVLDAVAPSRSKACAKRYKSVKFSPVEKQNLISFGFPYAGEIWIPHIGICAMSDEHIADVKTKFDIKDFSQPSCFDRISLYKLESEKPILINSFDLL